MCRECVANVVKVPHEGREGGVKNLYIARHHVEFGLMCTDEHEKKERMKLSCFSCWQRNRKEPGGFRQEARAVAVVKFDSAVTHTGALGRTAQFGHFVLDLFSVLCLVSQSCSVFVSCDIRTVTVFIHSSRELPCCNVCLDSKKTCIIPCPYVALSLDSHTW